VAVNPKVFNFASRSIAERSGSKNAVVQVIQPESPTRKALSALGLIAGTVLVVTVLIWQGLVAAGNPDPTKAGLSTTSMILSSGVLVLREGLEAVLVLATITAGLVLNKKSYWRAVVAGVVAGLAATVLTWFGVVAFISSVNAPEYDVQAATGLLAVVVLLVVMNWFFHKIYWTGWIGHHSSRRKKLLESVDSGKNLGTLIGFAALGFTAVYREGFEVVLFLQDLRLKAGSNVILGGAAFGLALTLIVAALTFIAHKKLPYKKMLVLTGGLLAMVLVVMVGESAQEMQQAHWISTTTLSLPIPDWAGVWFAIFPTVESLAAQLFAVMLVVGSYSWIRLQVLRTTKRSAQAIAV
jgi:high-affinity iron transporter